MTEYLTESFRAIHTPENFGLTPAQFRKKIIPKLIKVYQDHNPGASWDNAYFAVREAHIEYMGKLFPRTGIEKELKDGFVSRQTPVGETFYNCYRRNKPGLGLRVHTFSHGEKELFRVLYHGSPVPYEIVDPRVRLEHTIANLDELPGRTIVEIRLLSISPLAKPFTSKYFTELTDYDQLLETAIAAKFSKKNIILFNFAVNPGKYLPSELQTLLNIRALKQVFAKMSGKSFEGINYELDLKDDLETLKQKFLAKLKEENPESYNDLPQDAENTSASTAQKKHYREILILLKGGAKNHYKISIKLIELTQSLAGIDTVAAGCNDGKDRTGELAVRLEANQVALQRGVTSHGEIEKIREQLRKESTPAVAAEMISMPGFAKGLDIKENPDRKTAKFFKFVYPVKPPKMELQEVALPKTSTQTTEQPKAGFWRSIANGFRAFGNRVKAFFHSIPKLIYGALLAITFAIPTAPDAMSNTSPAATNNTTTQVFNFGSQDAAKEESSPNLPTSTSSSSTDYVDVKEGSPAKKEDPISGTPNSNSNTSDSFIDASDDSITNSEEEDEDISSSAGASPVAVSNYSKLDEWLNRKRNEVKAVSDAHILQNRTRGSSTDSTSPSPRSPIASLFDPDNERLSGSLQEFKF